MSGTELKTDASQRWMMYSKDAYGGGRIFLTTEQKQAVEEGKKFSQRAYADVWAKDAALVQRVRSFLGTHFHWHQRLAKVGPDLEVIQTLQAMIRGESVVLVAEQSHSGGSIAAATPAQPKMPSFRESLMTEYGMTYDAATAYIDRYNDMVDRVNAVANRYANGGAPSLADTVSDLAENATPLGDAQPFEYTPDAVSGEAEELAGTTNEKYARKMFGYDNSTFREMIHRFKRTNGIGPNDDLEFEDNGDVYFKGDYIDNFHGYDN
jgi:hypothetical protein